MGNNISYETIKSVIDTGLTLMRNPNLTEEQFRIWLDYSQKALNIASKNPAFTTNYLNVILATLNQNLLPSQKLSMCIKYLIGILHLL